MIRWRYKVVIAFCIAFVGADIVKKRVETRKNTIENERDTYARLMASYMDRTADPCDDFYDYSCGNYFKVHKVKYGVSSTDVFGIVGDEMKEAFHDILMRAPRTSGAEMIVTDKAKLFYQSCMKVNIFDFSKSEEYLKLIDSLGGWPALDPNWNPKHFDWFNVTIAANSLGVPSFMYLNTGNNVVGLQPSLFGIYAELDFKPFSRGYGINRELTMKILTMYGVSPRNAKKIFKEIIELGKEWHKAASKDFYFTLTPDVETTIDSIKQEVPELDWDRYFNEIFGQEVNSSTPIFTRTGFLKKLSNFVTKKNAKAAANYMFLQLLYGLHSEFRYPKYRKDFCVEKLKEVMGNVLTMNYLDSNYHQDTVEDEVMSMASYMRSAFKDIIKSVDWMDRDTKTKALIKLRDMRMVIGDVEFSLDIKTINAEYQDVHINPDNSFYESNLILLKHNTRQHLMNLIEPKSYRYESDVNAFYSPSENKMILPAGILRKPFFIPGLPAAYNYAAMGANILGHEMTHGFDSMGRNYDQDGEEVDWWSPESDAGFQERAKCFVEQYDAYRIPEMNVNVRGNLTLPENIADCGGVRQGFLAYQKWLNAHEGSIDMSRETLPYLNMTNYQLFFLSYAQSYCSQYKREMYRLLANDVHAANKFRVIGSVANSEEFGKHFNCKLGTTMNPEKKCVLW